MLEAIIPWVHGTTSESEFSYEKRYVVLHGCEEDLEAGNNRTKGVISA